MTDLEKQQAEFDGEDRRNFLKCMAWAGGGVLWTLHGGVLKAATLDSIGSGAAAADAALSFVQISDSHIGFHLAPNPDVVKTLQESVAKVNALSVAPAFVLHTGDVTHLAKPEQFDTAQQALKAIKTGAMFLDRKSVV